APRIRRGRLRHRLHRSRKGDSPRALHARRGDPRRRARRRRAADRRRDARAARLRGAGGAVAMALREGAVETVKRLRRGTGLHYNVVEWDAPGDHTVLLVHGFLDFAYGFAPLVEAGLEGRFHLVAPDLRGHGDSDRVGAGGYYHFADYIADLHDL